MMALIASISPNDGGPSNIAVALGRRLRLIGYANMILTTDADGRRNRMNVPLGTVTDWAGVPVVFNRVHFPRRFKASIGHLYSVWRHSRNADVMHIHGLYLWTTLVGGFIARVRGIPYVIQPHGGLEPYHQQKSRVVKRTFDFVVGARILRSAFTIVCASDSEAANINQLGFAKTIVIPHAVTSEDGDVSYEMQNQLAEFEKRQVVLFLGRLAKKKNPDLLIAAWASARPDDSVLVLAGPNDYWTQASLRQLVAENGLDADVKVLSAVQGPDKWALLRRANLFVLPSANENYGITVPEALMAGTACLVSDRVATCQDVRQASAGWVLGQLDLLALTEAFRACLSNPRELDLRGRRAAQYAKTRYDWQGAGGRYATLYENAIRGATR